MNELPQYSVLKKLTPAELIYAQDCDLSSFIDGMVSKMIEENKIDVNNKCRLKNKPKSVAANIYEFVAKETLRSHSRMKYNDLLRNGMSILLLQALWMHFKNITLNQNSLKDYTA